MTAERQGHPTGNFEKKTLKQQQSMNKGFWGHLKHFGRLLGKIYLFLTPSKTNARVLSHQGSHTTCNLTYSEVSQQTYVRTLETGLGVVLGKIRTFSGEGGLEKRVSPKGEIHPFSRERGLGGREKVKIIAAGAYHPDGSYSRHQIPFRHSDLSFFPATLSFQGHIISSTSPSQQKFAEQIDWIPLERAVMWLISGYCAIGTVHAKSISIMFMSSSRIKCTLS